MAIKKAGAVAAEAASPLHPKAEAIAPGRAMPRPITESRDPVFPGETSAIAAIQPGRGGGRIPPPPDYFPPLPDDAKPVVRFPQVERAASYLAKQGCST
jgi:hypothetical protein